MAHWSRDLADAQERIARCGGDLFGYQQHYRQDGPEYARQRWMADTLAFRSAAQRRDEALARRRPWNKLPPVSYPYERIPDRPSDGVRMVRCGVCKTELTSLGIGYHRQNTGH